MAESSYVEIRMVARLAENIETKEILVAGGVIGTAGDFRTRGSITKEKAARWSRPSLPATAEC